MSGIAALLVMVTVMLIFLGIRWYMTPPPIKARLAEFSMIRLDDKGKRSYLEYRLIPGSRQVAPRFAGLRRYVRPRNLERRLLNAGTPGGLTEVDFFGLQVMTAFAISFFLLIVVMGVANSLVAGVLGAVLGGGLGIALPIFWLNGEANRRQREITISMPDIIEVLAICVQSGMGFDNALEHIITRTSGALSEELAHFLGELRMGVPRKEAFGRLIHRNSSEELEAVVGALIQAQELGVPIARTLEMQADEMRERRLQRAEKAGAEASPKISLITTMLIAPSVMCLFVAIMVWQVIQEIGPTVLGP